MQKRWSAEMMSGTRTDTRTQVLCPGHALRCVQHWPYNGTQAKDMMSTRNSTCHYLSLGGKAVDIC